MNGTIVNQCERVAAAIERIAAELGTDEREAWRFAFNYITRARTRPCTAAHAATRAAAPAALRDLNPNSNLTIKQIDRSDGVGKGPSSKASINHFLDLDYVLSITRREMTSVPDWYVRWWHATQAANGWRTNQGKAITNYTWRPLLMTWWRNADEKERALIENELKAEKVAAEAKRVYSAADWAGCGAAGCMYYNDEKHLSSLLVAVPPSVPRRCTKFVKGSGGI